MRTFRPFRLAALLALSVLPFISNPVIAEEFPDRPVTLVIPYAVGGSTDIVARIIAQGMGETLGETVVSENRVGAGGQIGWNSVARAKPDGYTMLTTEMSFTIAPSLFSNLPFDAQAAFKQVGTAAFAPHVLVVNPDVPAKTVEEFVALVKANPGKFNYGSGGVGTNTHLGAELFKSLTGTDLMHIPYKGAGQVLQDLMAGQVHALITSLPTALPHINSGRLRALMVASKNRVEALPDVPSAPEVGLPGMVMDFWVGLSVPAGTPDAVIKRLNHDMVASVTSESGKQRLAAQGLQPVGNTPEEAEALVKSEMERWAEVIRNADIHAE
jgi:tripartite-type tricarboxylate transporter receptor subunit TctC